MAHYDFKQDLKEGHKGENIIANFLETKGFKFINDNNDNKYDIKMLNRNNKEITYEIKTDVYCKPNRDTGNLFVEFECRGKSSGIMVTQADWFVTFYKNLNEIWFIKSNVVKNLILSENFKETLFSGDSGSNTRGYLINRKKYKQYFHVCNI